MTRRELSVALALAAVTADVIHAQAPPDETKIHVMADVGPIPAPASCGCVTAPFTLTAPRPGWGYGSGPGAPDTDAPPSRVERSRQKEMDKETVANLRRMYDDALEGSGNASYAIGLELLTGTILRRDEVQATQWFVLGGSQGHPNAAAHAGYRYLRGIGIEQNDMAAAYWFSRAAEGEDKRAQIALGGLYAAGRAVPQSWALAVEWWTKAKEWRFVGDAYACGLGVPKSVDDATVAYKKAADTGDMQGAIQLGNLHAGGCARSADERAAREWYEKAADTGYPDAQVLLGELLLRRGPLYDPARAHFWARFAELRLPSGELRARAERCAAQAASEMTPFEVRSNEFMIQGMLAVSKEPMNR